MGLKNYGSSKANIGYYDKIVDQDDNVGVFSFTSVVEISRYNQSESRCDNNTYGPVCLDWNPSNPYRLPLGMKIENIQFLTPIIDFSPHFYILYSEWKESESDILKRQYDSLPKWQRDAIDNGWAPGSDKKIHSEWVENELIKLHPQRHARTLGELFKLIIEWSIVADEPFNNQEPAAKLSKLILEKLEMPELVKQEILESFPDTHVALYLQGNPDAQNRPAGVPNITPLFESWIEGKLLNYQYRGTIHF